MDSVSVDKTSIERSTKTAFGMIAECRFAEACFFLFQVHKLHFEEWIEVEKNLLLLAGDNKTLSTVFAILTASSKQTLSESYGVIPGLSLFRDPPDIQNGEPFEP